MACHLMIIYQLERLIKWGTKAFRYMEKGGCGGSRTLFLLPTHEATSNDRRNPQKTRVRMVRYSIDSNQK